MMTDLVRDTFDLARRLAEQRTAPPAPLPRAWSRDGPVKDHGPLPAPQRADDPHTAPRPRSWDWRSKGN